MKTTIRRLSSQLRKWILAKLGAVEPVAPPDPRLGFWFELDCQPGRIGRIKDDWVEFDIVQAGHVNGVYLNFGPRRLTLKPVVPTQGPVPVINGDVFRANLNSLIEYIQRAVKVYEAIKESA